MCTTAGCQSFDFQPAFLFLRLSQCRSDFIPVLIPISLLKDFGIPPQIPIATKCFIISIMHLRFAAYEIELATGNEDLTGPFKFAPEKPICSFPESLPE